MRRAVLLRAHLTRTACWSSPSTPDRGPDYPAATWCPVEAGLLTPPSRYGTASAVRHGVAVRHGRQQLHDILADAYVDAGADPIAEDCHHVVPYSALEHLLWEHFGEGRADGPATGQ